MDLCERRSYELFLPERAELEAEIDRILSITGPCPACGAQFMAVPDDSWPSRATETPVKGPTDEELAYLKANMAYFSPENEENRKFPSVKDEVLRVPVTVKDGIVQVPSFTLPK